MGLIDQLKLAATNSVVENLLVKSATYGTASLKTQRRWKYVAIRRLKEIQAATESKVVSERKTDKSSKKGKV